MSDVLMYWQPTPVLGVFDTELPQFTILGFETNDRQVRIFFFVKWNKFYNIYLNFCMLFVVLSRPFIHFFFFHFS